MNEVKDVIRIRRKELGKNVDVTNQQYENGNWDKLIICEEIKSFVYLKRLM